MLCFVTVISCHNVITVYVRQCMLLHYTLLKFHLSTHRAMLMHARLICTVRKPICKCALVRDPAEVLPKVAYELGVSALNLVQVFVFKRCILHSNTLVRS
jgi:hypothetical protein